MKHVKMPRRRFLRGVLQGTTVGVGLPLLDLFLNDNGTALANGAELPVCFGTWHWSLGLCHGQWVPEQTGPNYQLRPQIDVLAPVKDKINIYSGLQAMVDGASTQCHFSGQKCFMTGKMSDRSEEFERSIDQQVAEKFGVRTRFPSLTVSWDGDPAATYSSRGDSQMNPAETSPLSLYQRIFSNGFTDPNAAEFTPDPALLLRKSALSVVTEERQALMKGAGASDRAKLDEFFTSLRSLEQKLAFELQRPAPVAACRVPESPAEIDPNREIGVALQSHDLFAGLIAHALACGQTRVFNVGVGFRLVQSGDPTTFHQHTHEDAVDPVLNYQPAAFAYSVRCMSALKNMVMALDAIKEGDGSLLDRVLLLAYSDHGDARIHSYTELPFFTAGSAGGRLKTGWHIAANNETCSTLSLTCLQALGLPAASWGMGANRTSRVLSEALT